MQKYIALICMFCMGTCFGMKKEGRIQASLVSAIKKDNGKKVFELLGCDSKNALGDKAFAVKSVVPFLSHEDSRIRGLAAFVLFQKTYDGKLALGSDVFATWGKHALEYRLKDFKRMDSPLCAAKIRIMGDHYYGDTEKEGYGIVYAIAEPGTVSIPVQREDLDEFYLVVAGQGEVWLYDVDSKEESVTALKPGVAVKIPRTCIVQYRNTGEGELVLLVPTNPPYNVIGKKTGWKIEKICERYNWPYKKK